MANANAKISFNGRGQYVRIQYSADGLKTKSDKPYFGFSILYNIQTRIVEEIILGDMVPGVRVHAIFLSFKNELDVKSVPNEEKVQVGEKLPAYFERLAGRL